MKRFFFFFCLALLSQVSFAQGKTKNVYFPVDSFRLNQELVEFVEKALGDTPPGDRLTLRILIHDDTKNKGAINELDRKRSLELMDFLLAEGFPKTSLKLTKTIGREAKGFISDDMKNLFVYDLDVYKTLPAVSFTSSDEITGLGPGMQSFQLASGEDKTITAAGGTRINFPSNAFEYKTGLAAAGNLNVEIKEFLKPGDLAGAGLLTMSNEIPIQAAGFIWIKVTCGGKEVRLHKGKTITVDIPHNLNLTEPEFYTGMETDGIINLFEQDPKYIAKATDPKYYEFSSSTLHWIICAGKGKDDAKGSLTIKTGVSYPVAVRLVIKSGNQVLGAYFQPKAKDPVFTRLPEGAEGVLYAYGKKDGKIYFYSKPVTVSPDGKEKLQMKESSESNLKAFFQELNK